MKLSINNYFSQVTQKKFKEKTTRYICLLYELTRPKKTPEKYNINVDTMKLIYKETYSI